LPFRSKKTADNDEPPQITKCRNLGGDSGTARGAAESVKFTENAACCTDSAGHAAVIPLLVPASSPARQILSKKKDLFIRSPLLDIQFPKAKYLY
jgi:hypothetical protein